MRVEGLGFRVQGSGFNVQGSGFKVQGSVFRLRGSGFRIQGSGFGVQGIVSRVMFAPLPKSSRVRPSQWRPRIQRRCASPRRLVSLPRASCHSAPAKRRYSQFTRIGHVLGGGQPLWREGGPISYEARPSAFLQQALELRVEGLGL